MFQSCLWGKSSVVMVLSPPVLAPTALSLACNEPTVREAGRHVCGLVDAQNGMARRPATTDQQLSHHPGRRSGT